MRYHVYKFTEEGLARIDAERVVSFDPEANPELTELIGAANNFREACVISGKVPHHLQTTAIWDTQADLPPVWGV